SNSGTSNLEHGIDASNNRCGIKKGSTSETIGSQQTMHQAVSKYSPYQHCALIALCCAKDNRPFESVKDAFYLAEVELLHPGTKLPDPKTVSRDVNQIYIEVSRKAKVYFQVSLCM
ncbi:hypothetical protein K439DRAFT_1337798, partial [Ramaria rubella]